MDHPFLNESLNAAEIISAFVDLKPDILNLENNSNIGDAEFSVDDDPALEIQTEESEKDETAELSPGGVLDEETINRSLSNLGRSADGCHQVYLDVKIPGFSLKDISLLSEYQHLQKVELPYNNLTDLSALGSLKHLLYLDACHNKLEKLLDFEPPFNLQEVILSWNCIREMSDLSAHRFLKTLILNNNQITDICGLSKCRRLKHLSLSHNRITDITGLNDLPLEELNLSNNEIRFINNLESLKYLKILKLSGNCLRSLSGLLQNTVLESIDLEANEVIDVVEIKYLKNAKNLRELNLLRNPIQELPDCRLYILFRMSQLTILDRHVIKDEEKVAAANRFSPSPEVVAAQNHVMNVVYSFLQPSRVRDTTLPNIGTPYPMLVLVGPQGSGRKDLARQLVEDFKDYFGKGISHTTRLPLPGEKEAKDYHFVSSHEFENNIKMGEFIQTYQYNNNWYGLQMSSVEDVAREGLACVIHMELEGVLTLKKTYFEPRYVLVMPLSSEIHRRRLEDKKIYEEEQIKMIMKRAEMYIKYNQNHPGFFDMMINSDNLTEAYKQLCKLVMEYLGIASHTAVSTTNVGTVTDDHTETPLSGLGGGLPNPKRSGTWSKHSLLENVSQPQGSPAGSPSLSIVEAESVKRRKTAAKDLVAGFIPPLTQRLLMKYPHTAAQAAETSAKGKGHSAGGSQNISEMSASSDSSRDEVSDSHLFDFESTRDTMKTGSHKMNKDVDVKLPTKMVNPLDLINRQTYQSKPQTHSAGAYNVADSHLDPKHAVARPGSNKHPVLPPISNVA